MFARSCHDPPNWYSPTISSAIRRSAPSTSTTTTSSGSDGTGRILRASAASAACSAETRGRPGSGVGRSAGRHEQKRPLRPGHDSSLKHEVRDSVEDRLPFVDLDTLYRVDALRGKEVVALIDRHDART